MAFDDLILGVESLIRRFLEATAGMDVVRNDAITGEFNEEMTKFTLNNCLFGTPIGVMLKTIRAINVLSVIYRRDSLIRIKEILLATQEHYNCFPTNTPISIYVLKNGVITDLRYPLYTSPDGRSTYHHFVFDGRTGELSFG